MKGERAMSARAMREDWATPAHVFDPLHAEFRFTIDAAASHDNAKLPRYWTVDDADALEQPWPEGERVWLNPPYGARNLRVWMQKAYEAARDRGCTVVCLVPAYTGQPWWHECVIDKASDIRWIRGRIKFVGAAGSAPFPSCVVIYRPLTPAAA